jgi:exopolyphosphatase/guanosine-5'-triphosphate,3'-diphosphate pyrophosphatase
MIEPELLALPDPVEGSESELPAPPSTEIGAYIDLGTNSARMVLVRFEPEGGHTIIGLIKEVVRLGEGEFEDRRLQPAAMQRAILVCRKMVDMAQAYGAEHIDAIATSATRDARNQQEFLERFEAEVGVAARVISGREEARLIYLGVSSGVHLGESRALFIDIGGGSTELIVGTQREILLLDSMKLGAIRLSGHFFRPQEDGPVSEARYAQLKREVQNVAVRNAQRLRELPVDLAIGSSGTIENLADIAVMAFEGRPRGRDDMLCLDQLREISAMLRGLDLAARRAVPGINPARADIIVAGAAIIETLMEEFGLERIQVSDRGLREGLIIDELMQRFPERYDALSVRERSVIDLGRSCGFDEAHARTVRRLAFDLLDSAQEMGLANFEAEDRAILGHAAMLHDIGTMLSYTSHEQHSYYLVRNADLLGFDQVEIASIAALARFHRRGFPDKKQPELRGFSPPVRRRVRRLAILLRLAESLDRSHSELVAQARFAKVGRRNALLKIRSQAGDCHLEIWGALRQCAHFERSYRRRLVLEVDGRRIEPED